MVNSKLSEHKFKKGKFITPFNDSLSGMLEENPWFKNRIPEYIWLGMVIKYYGRNVGLIKCNMLLKELSKYSSKINVPKLSSIFNLPDAEQKNLYEAFSKIIDKEVLSPLTAIFTYSNYPCFSSFFFTQNSVEDRIKEINNVLSDSSNHQSEFSTDIRFLVLYYQLIIDKLYMDETTLKSLLKYPTLSHDDIEMRRIRPMVRATELSMPKNYNNDYLNIFWEGVSKLSECELYVIEIHENHENAVEYLSMVKNKLEYYTSILTSSRPLDNKMLVILGIATYAYKRLLEVVEHDLFQTITGRSIVRVLIENYIMLKYLLNNENSHKDIWTEYQYYGIGQYKLIVERYREAAKDLTNSHVMYDYMDLLVSEYKNKEFIDMDTTYFDKMNVREKAINVGEKELFGLYYDYDSAFEHGLWGAIRESSLLKCNSPAHQYHCVPDIENEQKMKDIWHDCKDTMSKIMNILKEIYGLPSVFDEEKENE